MLCPICHSPTYVLYTRSHANGIKRRRECDLNHRFTTLEVIFRLPKLTATTTTTKGTSK